MQRVLRFVLLVALLVSSGIIAGPARAQAQPQPGECEEGVLPHRALSLMCIPATGWNGDLVVWAHGYTAFNEPLGFQNLDFNGLYLPDLAQRLGFAFATTSYRQNGLAILEGSDDIRELVSAFWRTTPGERGRTYLTGASEGGIITTLLIEQSPELFSGGLAACGPIGDFQRQLDYIADFRVLFDFYFPLVLPGEAIHIPARVIENWDDTYVPRIKAAVARKPGAARELIRVSGTAIDPADPATIETTIINMLWYSAFATNDANDKLGGNPYDNTQRRYTGSSNDGLLNLLVKRYEAEPQALRAVKSYETTGEVTRPLITLHTTGDEIIPQWHERLYRTKVRAMQSTDNVTIIPINRYGHCNFTAQEVVGGFALLVLQVTGSEIDVGPALAAEQARQDR